MPQDILDRPILNSDTVLWVRSNGLLEPLRYNGGWFIKLETDPGMMNIARRRINPRATATYIKIPREELAVALQDRTLSTTARFTWSKYSATIQLMFAQAFIPLCQEFMTAQPVLPPIGPIVTSAPMTIQTQHGPEEIQIRETSKTKSNPEVELDFDF